MASRGVEKGHQPVGLRSFGYCRFLSCQKSGDSMAFVGRLGRVVLVTIPLVFVAIEGIVTTIASSRGACGDGDFRPSCGMFATAIVFYTLMAVDVLSEVATLALLVFRRRPPRLALAGFGLFVVILSLWLPVLAGGKLAGAVFVMLLLPFTALLVLGASICSLACLWEMMNRKRPA